MPGNDVLLLTTILCAVLVVAAPLLALRALTKRRGSLRRTSFWVITCEQRHTPAIVEVLEAAGEGIVIDCSCWRETGECDRGCAAHLASVSGQARLARGDSAPAIDQ